MARLPIPGGDDETWGGILNDFLSVAHNSDGTLQTSSLQNAGGVTNINGKTPSSGSVTLASADLSDISITTPSNNQVLTYNGTLNKWTNQTSAAAPVNSVFGRTGAITAQSGDYTAVQVGALPATDDLSAISSANATAGDVSLNGHKLKNIANGTAASDAAAFGQIPTTSGQVGAAQGLIPTTVKTSAYTAVPGDFVPVNVTTGNVAITLPTAPADKSRIAVKMVVSSGTHTVSIITGGSDVFNTTGGPTSLTLSLINQAVVLQYASAAGIWYVQGDDTPLSDLDTRYVQQGTLVYNVKDYGAKGDGSTDDTAAINNAISAVGTTGGIVFLPAGTYATSGTISINNDSIILRGAGWKSIIQPMANANFDAISTPIPASAGTSGFVRNYIGIEQLMIDCSKMTGTTAGQGNGIHWYGVRYSFIRDVLIQSCPNWAILLDGDNTGPGNNFGYDNQILRCIFDLCNANVYATNCEANNITECRFKWAGSACAALQPAFGSQDTTAMHLRCGSGYMHVTGNVFGKGGTYSTEAIRLSNNGPCRVIGNRFDQVRNQAITINAGNHIFVDNQLGSPSSNTVQFAIQIGSSNNTIMGNKFDNTAGAIHYSYAIGEAGGPFTNNVIVGNNLLAGSSGFISLAAGSADFLGYNPGYTGEVTTATSYTVLPPDQTILCNQSGAITITIPTPTNMASRVITVKDISGTAATNPITITAASGTIDGAANKKLSSNYDAVQLVTDGTNWYSLNTTPPPTPLAIYDGELTQTSSSAGVANTAYLVAVYVPAPVTITGIRVRFAAGGAGHYDVGIYKSDGVNGGPKTLVTHAAATATSLTTSSATLTPSLIGGNVNIDKGTYWLALWIDNATDTFNKQSGSGNMTLVMSGTTTGPLPSDATTLTGLANASLKPLLIGIRSGGWS